MRRLCGRYANTNDFIVCIHTQSEVYWMCVRCQNEGRNRLRKIKNYASAADLPFKYSKENTSLVFRYRGDDPLMELTPVEESLICLVSAVVTVQKIDPKNGKFCKL